MKAKAKQPGIDEERVERILQAFVKAAGKEAAYEEEVDAAIAVLFARLLRHSMDENGEETAREQLKAMEEIVFPTLQAEPKRSGGLMYR